MCKVAFTHTPLQAGERIEARIDYTRMLKFAARIRVSLYPKVAW